MTRAWGLVVWAGLLLSCNVRCVAHTPAGTVDLLAPEQLDPKVAVRLRAAMAELGNTMQQRGELRLRPLGDGHFAAHARFERDTGLSPAQLERNVNLILRKHLPEVTQVVVEASPVH